MKYIIMAKIERIIIHPVPHPWPKMAPAKALM